MFNHYRGKVYQVLETLDYADAVSTQAIRLKPLIESLGIRTQIYSKFSHPEVEPFATPLEQLAVSEEDIIFYHFSGFAKFSCDAVLKKRCTKVLIYHNITPDHYFPKGSHLYDLCHQGRMQLKACLPHFHFVTGDSWYNIEELFGWGLSEEASGILPIIIPKPNANPRKLPEKDGNRQWLFVGRIAPNKKQDALIRQFVRYREKYGCLDKLWLVGKYDEKDEYYKRIVKLITEIDQEEHVTLTGEVSEADLLTRFYQAGLYVSLSEHEGFGVPLVEATHFDTPVIALNSSAVSETLLQSPGLIDKVDDLPATVNRLFSDATFYKAVMAHQRMVRERYLPATVRTDLEAIFSRLIPSPYEYKSVSIVICTYNRGDFLDRCLDYLKYQTCSSFEVVVVNGPSNDNTSEVLEKHRSYIKVTSNPTRNLSISRNLGIEQASGDIVAFIDDDALPYDDWVRNLLKAHNSLPKYVAGTGGPVFYSGTLEFQDRETFFNISGEIKREAPESEEATQGWHRYLIGTNAAFKRESLLRVKGFDEQYDYFLDETDLCYRLMIELNELLYYDPELFVRHEFAQSDNRKGRYNYNWFTICKNTAYFIVKANPELGEEGQERLIAAHMDKHRIRLFQDALRRGELSETERDLFSQEVWKGAKKGIRDSRIGRKTREQWAPPKPYLPYRITRFFPVKNDEIGQLHIVLLTKEFPPFTKSGGIGTLYYHLANELLQMGHYVTVISQGDHEEEYERGRFILIKTPNGDLIHDDWNTPIFVDHINWSIAAREKILKLHSAKKIDVIDTSLWDFESFALLQDKSHGIPICVRLVTPLKIAIKINGWNLPVADQDLMVMAEREVIQNADRVIPISRSIERTIAEEYGLKIDHRWYRNYLGVPYWPSFDVNLGYNDFENVFPEIGTLHPKTFKVLFLGRLEKRKGIDVFLEAISMCLNENDDMAFLIAGEDIERYKEKHEYDKILGDKTFFLGRIEDAHKDILLDFADIIVFPSKYESFGLVPLEAFVHGKPVIAANTGAIPEIVIDGHCGLLFEAGDSKALADRIFLLLRNKKMREKLSQGAKERSKEFSSRKMAANTMQIYASLLS